MFGPLRSSTAYGDPARLIEGLLQSEGQLNERPPDTRFLSQQDEFVCFVRVWLASRNVDFVALWSEDGLPRRRIVLNAVDRHGDSEVLVDGPVEKAEYDRWVLKFRSSRIFRGHDQSRRWAISPLQLLFGMKQKGEPERWVDHHCLAEAKNDSYALLDFVYQMCPAMIAPLDLDDDDLEGETEGPES